MPAPTAIKAAPNSSVSEPSVPADSPGEDEIMIDVSTTVPVDAGGEDNKTGNVVLDTEGRPQFSSVSNKHEAVKRERRAVPVPPNRFGPLKNSWSKIYFPLVDHLKLQVKMDIRRKRVLLRTSQQTTDSGAIQKADDFLRAFMLGFDVDDATALLRLDDLYIESFEIKDVKALHGDHLSRAIGRIAGKDGKTKYAIENASRTRVVLADSKIHIMGGYTNIKIAREAVVKLILGKPPGKIYGNLRIVSSRMKERY